MKKKFILGAFFILLAGVGAFVYHGQRETENSELYYSGTIEAKTSDLAFQISGKVETVEAKEGILVNKGQLLARLVSDEYRALNEKARANLQAASKTVHKLQTLLELYKKTLPADVERAQAGEESAKAVLKEAKADRGRLDTLFHENVISRKEWEAVNLKFETAEAKLKEAEAITYQAKSALRKIDSTRQEIEVAKANMEAIRASLKLTAIRLAWTSLFAPFDGFITSRNVEPGEVVTPGQEVLSLADLSTVDLRIYVDETSIGKVKLNQRVDVTIDSFSDKVYTGTVSFISPEGEFTPKFIQTHKERVKLVYLVKVSIANPNIELKSGMPADARLR